MNAGTGTPQSPEDVAAGFLTVAVDTMANAIKHVSLTAGHDPADFTLACFGGAGGQHACRVAAALGIRTIFIDRFAGVLSAVGIGLAQPRALRRGTLAQPLGADGIAAARSLASELAARAEGALEGAALAARETRAEIRTADSDVALGVEFGTAESMAADFREAHARRFGYRPDPATPLVIAAVSVELIGAAGAALPAPPPVAPVTGVAPTVSAWFEGAWREVPLLRREALPVGTRLRGPAIIGEATGTTVVEPGWDAELVAGGGLVLRHDGSHAAQRLDLGRADPVLIEVFGGLFMHVAEQMGTVLRQAASSVNIRERLDYSCAVFDADGRLVANAPHMPVHLGSMGASVRAVRDLHGASIRPGDSFLVNSPYAGGTHLPDLTVVSPVHLDDAPAATFWVASRAHHADIGGVTPGSMPPFSHRIDEEGALFDGERIVSAGRFDAALVRAVLARGPYPARSPDRNLADLAAQLAANARGSSELARLVRQHGRDAVSAYMGHVQKNAEARVRTALKALPMAGLGPVRHERELDGGERIVVTIDVDGERGAARIDFTGTSAQSGNNFNAPRAVCTAAVLYVFRTLVDGDIPLNEGCLAPLELVIPAGSLLDPRSPAAVVAGNVETSQAIVDLLYGALGVLADSQGTMNNFTFGDADCQYYETIAGGAGAGPGFDGASGVQTHMTNSRLTDPEVLESRLPVFLRAFRYRRGSGGAGRWRGGDGLVRRVEFRRPLEAAILANNRRHPPRGLAGGANGAPGVTTVHRLDGTTQVLGATDAVRVVAGDAIEIETPGGGGFGTPDTGVR
jgi:5-oxoprolinase (ATP-hydrolysing)